MATENQGTSNPRVFISYSWDSPDHRLWVESLATQLRQVGVDARLDAWRDEDQSIDDFMMVELERADFVLAICTPEFKKKVLSNAEGTENTASGFEIGTAAAFRRVGGKPIIPVLVSGDYSDAAPSNLLGHRYYDFALGDPKRQFTELKDRLLGHEASLPELGAISAPAQRPALPDIFADSGESAPVAAAAGVTRKAEPARQQEAARPVSPTPPQAAPEKSGGGKALWIGLAAVVIVIVGYNLIPGGDDAGDTGYIDQGPAASSADTSFDDGATGAADAGSVDEPGYNDGGGATYGVEIPNFAGWPYEDARNQLLDLGFATSATYPSDEQLPGTILQVVTTDPGPGDMASSGADVTLYLEYALSEEDLDFTADAGGDYLEVPDVVGQYYEDARDDLLNYGFNTSASYSVDDNYPDSSLYVVAMSPEPGEEAAEGSEITLYLDYDVGSDSSTDDSY